MWGAAAAEPLALPMPATGKPTTNVALALEFIDFVVPIARIREEYPGGWEQCLHDHADLIGGRVWYDDHLF